MKAFVISKRKVAEPLSYFGAIVLGWLIFIVGIIALFVFCFEGADLIGFVCGIGGLTLGTILIGIGRIIELLAKVVNKDYLVSEADDSERDLTNSGTPSQLTTGNVSKQEVTNKRIVANTEEGTINGFSVLNGILYISKKEGNFESASISIGGSFGSTNAIDGLLGIVTLCDVFGEVVYSRKITFIDVHTNGNLFLTESVPISISEHDAQRIQEARVKITNYSQNGKKVLA